MKHLILAILLMGCSDPMPPNQEHLHYSWCLHNVPEEDKPFIAAAMEEWNTATAVTTWTIGECQGNIWRKDLLGENPNYAGLGRVGNVEYQTNVNGNHLRLVIMHELGHAARLNHSDNPYDIMYGHGTKAETLTQHDLTAFFTEIAWK